MTTTLNKIKAKEPCVEGWTKLLKGLGKTESDNEELEYTKILEINGLDDTLWCLDNIENMQKELTLFAVWCARKNRHLFEGEELEKFDGVLEVVEKYANGLANDKDLASARAYARTSTSTSVYNSTRAFAYNSAWASTRVSALNSAWASASTSARDSASNSAYDSAWEEIIQYFIENVLHEKE